MKLPLNKERESDSNKDEIDNNKDRNNKDIQLKNVIGSVGETKKKEESFFRKIVNFISIEKNPAFVLILVGFFLNLAGVAILYYFIRPSETGVILHYNSFLGIDVIAFDLENYYYQLYHGPMSGMMVLTINSVLSVLIMKQNKKSGDDKGFNKIRNISTLFLLVGSILVQLVVLVYILAIVKINGWG